MKGMQMVSSQEKDHYVLAAAANGVPVTLILDALHYQSAANLLCKQTNRSNLI